MWPGGRLLDGPQRRHELTNKTPIVDSGAITSSSLTRSPHIRVAPTQVPWRWSLPAWGLYALVLVFGYRPYLIGTEVLTNDRQRPITR
jgi:hypothetical protein